MSIVDVARKAGVSVSTVSRVINRQSGVSAETAALIRAAMCELGYVPPTPERRRGPKTHRSGTLSRSQVLLLLGSRHDQSHECDYLLSRLEAGLQEGAAEHGATLCIGSAAEAAHEAALDEGPQTRALFVIDSQIPEAVLARYAGLPVVQLLTPSPVRQRTWDAVCSDGAAVGRHAAAHLVGRGHRDLCVVNPVPCWAAAAERATAFMACACLAGQEVALLSGTGCAMGWLDDSPVDCTGHRRAVCEAVARAFLELRPRPTGVFATSDAAAAQFYRLMGEAGLVIGRDLEVVSCNHDHAALAPLVPRPLTYDLQAYEIGRQAMEVAAARVAGTLRLPAVRVDVQPQPVLPPALAAESGAHWQGLRPGAILTQDAAAAAESRGPTW